MLLNLDGLLYVNRYQDITKYCSEAVLQFNKKGLTIEFDDSSSPDLFLQEDVQYYWIKMFNYYEVHINNSEGTSIVFELKKEEMLRLLDALGKDRSPIGSDFRFNEI